MPAKRGRTITTFGQMFGGLSGAYIPPETIKESLGWLGINQESKLGANNEGKLASAHTHKLAGNIRGN